MHGQQNVKISYHVIKGFNYKGDSLLFLAVHLITFVICEVKVSCSSTLFLMFIMSDMNIADQSNIHLQDLDSNTMVPLIVGLYANRHFSNNIRIS